MKIIACDFDGTLCENKFPDIGSPNTAVIERLKNERLLGAKIILWTCREKELLESALEWCESFGLVFDAVNDNLKETNEKFGYNSRKIYATEYWDDRSVQLV